MTYEQLDQWFPWLVFFYGAILTFVLNSPRLMQLAETRLPPRFRSQLMAHRTLGLVCLLVGAAWTVQNIWSQPLFL